MRRWRVYKDPEDRWLRWIAVPAHENWWDKPQGIRFPQWDMALRYATRMAQTATLTVKDSSGEFCDLTATANDRYNDQHHIHLKTGDDTFILAPHEWEPLARFLLKEARKQEEA